jgi:hypothetical protein
LNQDLKLTAQMLGMGQRLELSGAFPVPGCEGFRFCLNFGDDFRQKLLLPNKHGWPQPSGAPGVFQRGKINVSGQVLFAGPG